MIGFWDFKLSGAPPLLSFGVRRPSLLIQSEGRQNPGTHDCPGGAVSGQSAHPLRGRAVPVRQGVVPCWTGTPAWCEGSILLCEGERPW
jgi:hypothetical protein